MTTDENKRKLLDFLRAKEFGVLSTLSAADGYPESAVVALSETDDLELVFGSFIGTRKNVNIVKNPHVSVVIGWDNTEKITVQYEGTAQEISGQEREILSEKHCIKNADSIVYLKDENIRYFKITPTWVRYSNFSQHPKEVWEIRF
jgi:general stress protein 26